jgi:hypothetical protein
MVMIDRSMNRSIDINRPTLTILTTLCCCCDVGHVLIPIGGRIANLYIWTLNGMSGVRYQYNVSMNLSVNKWPANNRIYPFLWHTYPITVIYYRYTICIAYQLSFVCLSYPKMWFFCCTNDAMGTVALPNYKHDTDI